VSWAARPRARQRGSAGPLPTALNVMPRALDEIGVREKYRIGTAAETSASLRLKAADVLRIAAATEDLEASDELRLSPTGGLLASTR
jgi:hypothetical protein